MCSPLVIGVSSGDDFWEKHTHVEKTDQTREKNAKKNEKLRGFGLPRFAFLCGVFHRSQVSLKNKQETCKAHLAHLDSSTSARGSFSVLRPRVA
jgi:hypothetical protein